MTISPTHIGATILLNKLRLIGLFDLLLLLKSFVFDSIHEDLEMGPYIKYCSCVCVYNEFVHRYIYNVYCLLSYCSCVCVCKMLWVLALIMHVQLSRVTVVFVYVFVCVLIISRQKRCIHKLSNTHTTLNNFVFPHIIMIDEEYCMTSI